MEAAATLGGPERLPVPLVRVFSQHIVGMPIMWHVQLRSRGYSREQNRLAALRASLLGPGGGTAPPAQTPHSQITPVCTSWIRGPRDAEQPRRVHWSVSLS